MIRVDFDDGQIQSALANVLARLANPQPMMIEIGELVANSTMARFATATAPDGSEWKTNEQSTVDIYNSMFASAGAKRPLVGETRRLGGEISWQLDGRDAVEIGSPLPYAAMQQFGGTKAQWPHLWGDIPARPYLGISDDDERDILDIVARYLQP